MSLIKLAEAKWRAIAKKIAAQGGAATPKERRFVNLVTSNHLDNLSYRQMRLFNKAEKLGLDNNHFGHNVAEINPPLAPTKPLGKLRKKLRELKKRHKSQAA